MIVFCFIFTFAFEQFVSYLYFSNKFETKKSTKFIALLFGISFVIQYLVNLIGNPNLNLLTFFTLNAIIVLLCFHSSIKQLIFHIILLGSIMLTTELVVMYLTTLLLNINLMDYTTNSTVMFLETAATKALYFVVAYIISKISFKESKNRYKNDFSFMLFILPLSSIAVIVSFDFLSINFPINQTSNMLFIFISILLLLANVVVFLVHEKMMKTLNMNYELQLAKQKQEINDEYYSILQKQQDSSNILIHDIKRHLQTIKELSSKNSDVIKYIDSIYSSNKIKSLRQYSNNKLVNVIISRYAEMCDENKIDFFVDIRNIDFSFINSNDLTAILDNLLENAYEASKTSEKQTLSLFIETKNENYIMIDISNSSTAKPTQEKGNFITSKQNKNMHGIGLKSVNRLVAKYYGDICFKYDDENQTFEVNILLKIS